MKKTIKSLLLILLIAFTFTFMACAPSSSADAKAKMEKAGYSAVVSTLSEVGENGEVATIACTKTGDGNIFSQIGSALENAFSGTMYDSYKSAKAAYDKTKDAESNTSAVLSGKWVIYGNEESVKAFSK